MDQNSCRDTFARLIGEETDALGELATLLDREYEHLTANAIEELKAAMKQRQSCVTRILRVDEERKALCRKYGKTNDLAGLEQLMLWCDPELTLAEGWRKCTEAATHAQKLNDRNGTVVGVRLTHVRDRLGTLLDGRRSMNTYGRRGFHAATVDSGRLLAAKV